MRSVLDGSGPGRSFWTVFVRTFAYVGIALAGCLAIGYPVAYYLARHARRTKALLLVLLIIPFWVSYLMRMLAWIGLLLPDGLVNRIAASTSGILATRTAGSTGSRRRSSSRSSTATCRT